MIQLPTMILISVYFFAYHQVFGKRVSKSVVSGELKSRSAALRRAFDTLCTDVPMRVAISLVVKPSRERTQTLIRSFGNFCSKEI